MIPVQGYGSIKDMKFWSSNGDVFMAVLVDTRNENFPSKVRIIKAQFTSSVEGTKIIEKVNL